MIHRIMLVAALLAVPAIVVAQEPVASTHAQHADSAKAKKHSNKKSTHHTGSTGTTAKAAPSNGTK